MSLRLRRASATDTRLLFEWRNDPETRQASLNQAEISWATHVAWLDQKLRDPDCRIWMLERDGDAVGQVRYERDGPIARISLSIAAAFRGRGLGAELLKRSVPLACLELGPSLLVGVVLPANTASQHVFERAGFSSARHPSERGTAEIHYERPCGHP
jgi:RimJ/RimL family protein N-acetyltransferase